MVINSLQDLKLGVLLVVEVLLLLLQVLLLLMVMVVMEETAVEVAVALLVVVLSLLKIFTSQVILLSPMRTTFARYTLVLVVQEVLVLLVLLVLRDVSLFTLVKEGLKCRLLLLLS